MRGFSTMCGMADPTVDDFPAEADALEVRPLELESIDEDEVREPHRHAYHELIWVREGSGRHLIDGEPVEFGPAHADADREGTGAPVRARGSGEWRRRALRRRVAHGLAALAVLGQACTALRVPEEDAHSLRRPARAPARGGRAAARARSPPSCAGISCRPRSCGLSAGARPSSRAAAPRATTCSSTSGFQETLERDFARTTRPRHYAAELGVTTGTLSRTLMRLSGRTTKQLILDRVLLEAARLLRFSDLSREGDRRAARLHRPVRVQQGLQAPARRGAAGLPQPPLAAPGAAGVLRVLDLVVGEEQAVRVPVGPQGPQHPPGVGVEEHLGVHLALLEVEVGRSDWTKGAVART